MKMWIYRIVEKYGREVVEDNFPQGRHDEAVEDNVMHVFVRTTNYSLQNYHCLILRNKIIFYAFEKKLLGDCGL
jgi:hypothetical protein